MGLALTEDELLFAQWVPQRLVRIPHRSIVEVSRAKSHLGKWIGQPLLEVTWTETTGPRIRSRSGSGTSTAGSQR